MANKDRARYKEQLWQEAAKKYKLTTTQVFMGKRLGLNPKKFPKYAYIPRNPDGSPKTWKKPLGQFIEKLYCRQFPKTPEGQRLKAEKKRRKLGRRERRRLNREQG